MTHEPECPMNLPIGPTDADCPFCPVIRIAYQRGREDAAANLGAFIAKYYYHFVVEIVEPLLAAARGDGEQA